MIRDQVERGRRREGRGIKWGRKPIFVDRHTLCMVMQTSKKGLRPYFSRANAKKHDMCTTGKLPLDDLAINLDLGKGLAKSLPTPGWFNWTVKTKTVPYKKGDHIPVELVHFERYRRQ